MRNMDLRRTGAGTKVTRCPQGAAEQTQIYILMARVNSVWGCYGGTLGGMVVGKTVQRTDC